MGIHNKTIRFVSKFTKVNCTVIKCCVDGYNFNNLIFTTLIIMIEIEEISETLVFNTTFTWLVA
jgi:hypothetical protein